MPSPKTLSYKTAQKQARERFAAMEQMKKALQPKGEGELLSYFNRLSDKGIVTRYAAMQVELDKARTPAERASGVPVVDFSLFDKDPVAFSYVFVDSLAKNGFAIIKNHGVAQSVRDAAFDATKELFTRPESYTSQYVVEGSGYQRGVIPFGAEIHKPPRQLAHLPLFNQKGDMKYSFSAGPEAGPKLSPVDALKNGLLANVWPDEPRDFRRKLLEYNAQMDATAEKVQKALGVGLGVGENFLAEKMRLGDHLLRTHLYPARETVKETGGDGIGVHTDRCFFTLLLAREQQQPGAGQKRLVVLPNIEDPATWVGIDTGSGHMILNIGKAFDRATRGYFPATYHGVFNSKDPSEERTSGPKFYWVGYEEKVFEIACPPPMHPSPAQAELSRELISDFPAGKATFHDLRRGMSSANR